MVEVNTALSGKFKEDSLEDRILENEHYMLKLLDALVEMEERICSLERTREMSIGDSLR